MVKLWLDNSSVLKLADNRLHFQPLCVKKNFKKIFKLVANVIPSTDISQMDPCLSALPCQFITVLWLKISDVFAYVNPSQPFALQRCFALIIKPKLTSSQADASLVREVFLPLPRLN